MSDVSVATLVDTVREHADRVIGIEVDGGGAPPLPDALDPETREAIERDARDVADGRRLSNFAVQQEFLRTLVALSGVTGDERYREAAADVVDWAFRRLDDPGGLLYWGGHAAYDIDAGEVVVGKNDHELKYEYPFYEFLFAVDPDRTRRFVERQWEAHVLDWSVLDFDRHGSFGGAARPGPVDDAESGSVWDREYEGGDVFFWGDGLTFVNAGSDLYYAAATLADLTGGDAPLEWAARLARRYVETRREPGVSGYQFSQHPSHCNGPAVLGDRAQYQFAPYVHGDHLVYESTLFRPRPVVQRQQLALGERLGVAGERFTDWAVEELRAWYDAAYRPGDNAFEPMLTDGHSLDGFVIRREGYFGPKGRVVGPTRADWEFFWTYARACRVAGDPVCWAAARDVADGLGLGDIGVPGGEAPSLDGASGVNDYAAIHGLLDLYDATGRDAYVDAAARVAQNVLDRRRNGVLAWDGRVDLEDPAPLALLHLAAVLRDGDRDALPRPVGYRKTPEGGI
ncbi:MAG: pectate lyase [Haloarculaceae archaeon]